MTDPPLVAVDIGNSSTKIGWRFELSEAEGLPAAGATRSIVTGQPPPDELREALPQDHCRWHIASVHREGTRILHAWLQANRAGDEVLVRVHGRISGVAVVVGGLEERHRRQVAVGRL